MNDDNCIYLSNFYDPNNNQIKWPESYIEENEAAEESRRRFKRWMETKTVALPQSNYIDSESLREQGMVGIYFCAERGDFRVPIQTLLPNEIDKVDDVEFFCRLLDEMEKLANQLDQDEPAT